MANTPTLLRELRDLLDQHPDAVFRDNSDGRLVDLASLGQPTHRAVQFAQALRWSASCTRLRPGQWLIPPGALDNLEDAGGGERRIAGQPIHPAWILEPEDPTVPA